jgi:hypothetical protein
MEESGDADVVRIPLLAGFTNHTTSRRRGRQKSRRYGFFSFHDLRQRIPQKVEKS